MHNEAREKVWAVFKSQGEDSARKTGVKEGIAEGPLKRVIRRMVRGDWVPNSKQPNGAKKQAKKAVAKKAAAKKAPAKKAAAAKKEVAKKASSKKAKAASPAAKATKGDQVKLTYAKKKKRVGTLVSEGAEASTIAYKDGELPKEETVANEFIEKV